MELVAEREDALFRTAFLLVASRTSESGVKFVFVEGVEQSLSLHQVGVHLAAVGERTHTGFKRLHV